LAYNAKYRYNYASGVEVSVPISETITVKTDEMGQKYALTSEAIQQTQPSTVIIAGFTETTNPNCLAGEFYVDYSISNNLLLFNSSQVEGDLTIAYNGLGTSVSIQSHPRNLPDGSASEPSLSFMNDSDTGIYSISDNVIGIASSGTKVGQIDSNGITIGTPYLCIVDEKASGTSGGTFTSGAWRVRTLNTIRTNTIQGASLASDTITLPQGKYRISALCNAYQVAGHKAKLYNVTDSTDIIIGNNSWAGSGDSANTLSLIIGIFDLDSSKALQIQHRCNTTLATNGFGVALSFGVVEVYAQVEVWKIG
jgi:hypothetical protein